MPSNISQYLPEVVYLDLSFNQITHIIKKDFVRHEKLEVHKLSHNQIPKLPNEVFANLNKLSTLLLNNNKISQISRKAFVGLNNLNYLGLFGNPVSKLERGTFDNLPLIELNIYNTKLKTIPSHLVTAKLLISLLNLKNNSITYIDENAFYKSNTAGLLLANNNIKTLKNELFTSSNLLEVLDVSGNNLRCDCNMSKFLNSLKTKKVIATCSSPSIVAGQDLKTFRSLCNCSQGFDGDTCYKEIPCLKNYCKNNGTCEPTGEKRFVNGSHRKNDESCKRNEVIGL